MKLSALLPLSLVLALGISHAQQAGNSSPRGAIGLGVGINLEPYAELDDEAQIIPVPVLSYSRGRVAFLGKSIAVNLAEGDNWDVGGVLDYRFQGYDSDDSPVFEEMEDRDGTLEAGFKIGYGAGPVTVSLQTLFDVLDNHGGYTSELLATYDWKRGRATSVSPFIGLTHHSEDFTQYYYGVDPDEERIINTFAPGGEPYNRFVYSPGSTTSPIIGLTARQAISRNWIIFLRGSYEFLPDDITDSPLIDKDTRGSIGVGLARVIY